MGRKQKDVRTDVHRRRARRIHSGRGAGTAGSFDFAADQTARRALDCGALAMEPEVLLFDQSTSSLDSELVGEVLRVIRALAKEARTMLLVRHELGFAYHFADRVVFIAGGVVHETGTAGEGLKHPQREGTQAFLARFTERTF